jgi:hypothetical protein
VSKALSASNAPNATSEINGSTQAVVALIGHENEAYEIAERIDKREHFGRQAAARSANRLILSPPFPGECAASVRSAGSMLVDPNDRAVDHSVFETRRIKH